jgi:hypothetical protein
MGTRTIEELKNCIIKAWESLDKSTCEELALIFKDRVTACYEANGFHTKY